VEAGRYPNSFLAHPLQGVVSLGTLGHHGVIHNQHQYRTYHGDQNTPQIDPSDARITKRGENFAADKATNHPENQVADKAFATPVDYLTANKTGDGE
jgi:hypothetical protein